MRFWTIAYQEKDSLKKYPVYEGRNDGRYYLGGTARILFPLIFSTKKHAEQALTRVIKVEKKADDARSWVENGKFVVCRCSIAL